MTKQTLYRNGAYVRDIADDEDYVAKDGETIRTNGLAFMDGKSDLTLDGALHAPGYVTLADADAQRRQTMLANDRARLSDAWKNLPALDSAHAPAKPAIAPGMIDARESAYDRRDNVLTNAWRHA